MKYFFTYKTTNRINGKIYYGKHETHNLEDGYLGSGVRFSRAVKKYGAENFTREVLSFYPDRESMVAAEKALITEDVVKSKNTYNDALGGHGGNLGPVVNAKIGQIMSIVLKGKKKTNEHCQAIKEAQLARNYSPTAEVIEKIRNTTNANYATLSSEERKQKFGTRSKKVIIDGVTYLSHRDARTALGISKRQLLKLLGE